MSMLLLLLVLVVIAGLAFDYVNGFHDTANAIATVVSTGVLPIRTAILMAAVLNFGGALHGTAVAATIGKDVLDIHLVTQAVVLSALCAAIFWNLFTWYFGIPSSSSHALIGGLVGAGVARAGVEGVKVAGLTKIVAVLILSPVVGFFIAFLVMIAIFWAVRGVGPAPLARAFRRLQMISAAGMAYSHGSSDAQKTMGVIAMSLVVYHAAVTGHAGSLEVPTWVKLACATAMAFGTAAGGMRIIKTMGTKIIDIKPIHGFAAETAAAATILTSASLGFPLSTTHVITGCIMGAGASQRVSAVRWGVTTKILWAWVLTIPTSAGVAWLFYAVVGRLFPL
jgi:PiT family inorganic phosphate transporter